MNARNAIYAAAVLMAILHQDWWFWHDRSVVLGFLPVGLAYHVFYSLAAGCLWFLAVKFAWPTHVEDFAEEGSAAASDSARKGHA